MRVSASQQAQLNTAILLLGATKLHDPAYQGQSSFGPETLRTEFDGKTFDQILAAAKATGTTFQGQSPLDNVQPNNASSGRDD